MPARKLRWFQYSLRSLLLLTLLVSLVMSCVAVRMQRARRQDEAVEEIEKLGGQVQYDYEAQGVNPPGPAWLRNLLGENFFATVVAVDLSLQQVTDAGLEHLKGLTQIQTLCLVQTMVTDEGVKKLQRLAEVFDPRIIAHVT